MKITQKQFDKIVDLVAEIQEIDDDIDTSSIHMSLEMAEIIEDQICPEKAEQFRRERLDVYGI